MATAKKAATKKPVAKKAPVKKAPTKKASVKKSTSKKATTSELRSFRVAKNQPPFTSFKITKQTVYWIILVSFIIFAQLWIIKLQIDVANLIEVQQQEMLNDI